MYVMKTLGQEEGEDERDAEAEKEDGGMSHIQPCEQHKLGLNLDMMLNGVADIAVPRAKRKSEVACAEGGGLGLQDGQGGGVGFMSDEDWRRKRSRLIKVLLCAHVFVDRRRGAIILCFCVLLSAPCACWPLETRPLSFSTTALLIEVAVGGICRLRGAQHILRASSHHSANTP